MNKRAISPLISTIVLIVFASVLGLVVIGWGSSQVELTFESECEDVSLSIVTIKDIPQVCYKNNELEIIAENKGNINIVGMKLIIIGEEDITREEAKGILISDASRQRIAFDNVGTIQKIILIPKILQNKAEELCSDNSVEIEDIKACYSKGN